MNYHLSFKKHTSKDSHHKHKDESNMQDRGRGRAGSSCCSRTPPRASTQPSHLTVALSCRVATTTAPPRKWPRTAVPWFSCAAGTRSTRARWRQLVTRGNNESLRPTKERLNSPAVVQVPRQGCDSTGAPLRFHSAVAPSSSGTTPRPPLTWAGLATSSGQRNAQEWLRVAPESGPSPSGALLPESQLTNWEKPERSPPGEAAPAAACVPAVLRAPRPRPREVSDSARQPSRARGMSSHCRVKPEPQWRLLRSNWSVKCALSSQERASAIQHQHGEGPWNPKIFGLWD